jgi:hypothetical protein
VKKFLNLKFVIDGHTIWLLIVCADERTIERRQYGRSGIFPSNIDEFLRQTKVATPDVISIHKSAREALDDFWNAAGATKGPGIDRAV